MAEICAVARCEQHRRSVRKQLQRWSKNVLYLVGFEEVAQQLMGREKWATTAAPHASTSKTEHEVKDFDLDDPQDVHDPICPRSSLTNFSHDQLAMCQSLLPAQSCSCDPPVDDCSSCYEQNQNSNEDTGSESSLIEETCEQPLDLSTKGCKESDEPPPQPDAMPPQSVSKISPIPRKTKETKTWNRKYHPEQLDKALAAIMKGEVGTRRAALQYNVPRSTLRNKVYKMNFKPASRKKNITTESSSPSTSIIENKKLKGGKSSDSRGQTSEALREMLMKRDSFKTQPTSPQLHVPSANPSSPFYDPNFRGDPSLVNTQSSAMKESTTINTDVQTLEYMNQLMAFYQLLNLAASQQPNYNENSMRDLFQYIVQYNAFLGASGDQSNGPMPQNYDPSSWNLLASGDPSTMASQGNHSPPFNATSPPPSSNNESTEPENVILKVPSYKKSSKSSRGHSFKVDKSDSMGQSLMHTDSPQGQFACGSEKSEENLNGIQNLSKNERRKLKRNGDSMLLNTNDQSNDGSGNRNRPKRGRYRNYNREDLDQAVKAVQEGRMSVHKAGNHFGVPHSTLEYKVKDRRLLRQKKQSLSGEDGFEESGRRDSRASSSDSLNLANTQVATDGNDSNNNSLWNEQLSVKSSIDAQSAFVASEKMRILQGLAQKDVHMETSGPSSGSLLEELIKSGLDQPVVKSEISPTASPFDESVVEGLKEEKEEFGKSAASPERNSSAAALNEVAPRVFKTESAL